MLLQYRIVEINALEIVLPGELLGLISDFAERVLSGRAREQLGAAHEGEELCHLLVHCCLHILHAGLKLH